MPPPLTAERQGINALRVVRDFAGATDMVWRAFTEAHILRRWLLGPPGWDMDRCHINARAGQGYHWAWRDPATGTEIAVEGQYEEVAPPFRLVDRQTFRIAGAASAPDQSTRNCVTFHPIATGTRVMTVIQYPDAQTRELVLQQKMPDGMQASYLRLDRLLPGLTFAQTA